MSRYWSELVQQLTPYVPGEQPKHNALVKLNTNESPYDPSPAVLAAIAGIDGDNLRLYPDPESTELKRAIARRNALQPEQVFIGNGSDEVLAHTFQALLKHYKPLYFPDISYSFYPVWCDLYDIAHCDIPVADDFSIDPDTYPAVNGGIVIPNPNAPTGMLMGLDAIRRVLQRSRDSVVVIDEAYIDFGGESACTLIDSFPNLLVVQTLSKSRALAGLRVGWAMGHALLIDALERVKNSFNSYPLDVLAQHAAVASIEDDDYFVQTCQRVIDTRATLSLEMSALGFEVVPSAANFIFVRHRVRPARELFAALRERGIIVRYFDKPRINNYLRITIGTNLQCDTLLAALQELLG